MFSQDRSYDLVGALTQVSNDLKEEIVASSLPDCQPRDITGWDVKPISANTIGNGTLGFARVQARLETESDPAAWSSVVKGIGPPTWPDGTEYNDPAREVRAYRSGFLQSITGGLQAPKCYAATDLDDNITWLWLQDLSDEKSVPWDRDDFVIAAYHVGQFNGAWPESRQHSFDWIPTDGSTDQPSSALRHLESRADDVPQVSIRPTLQSWTDRVGTERIKRLLPDFKEIVSSIQSLPRSIAHNDMYNRNMFATHDHSITYAFDWASLGYAPVGADGGGLFGSSVSWGHDEALLVGEIETEIFDSYVDGLESVGWKGQRDNVRLAYLATASIYIVFMAFNFHELLSDGDQSEWRLKRFAGTKDEVLEQTVERLNLFIPLIDEAVTLASQA